MNIEYNALNAMDPNSPYGSAGQTVQDRLSRMAGKLVVAGQLLNRNIRRCLTQRWSQRRLRLHFRFRG